MAEQIKKEIYSRAHKVHNSRIGQQQDYKNNHQTKPFQIFHAPLHKFRCKRIQYARTIKWRNWNQIKYKKS